MWKEYSSGYLKNNRAAGAAIMIAAFISALLLSLLCSLFYNAWKYETERIRQKEGDWQSRITGTFSQADIDAVQTLYGVKKAAVTSLENAGGEPALELVFADKRQVFAATPQIAEMLGASAEDVDYHYGLLALYLIRSPQDSAPRLLFPLF